MTFDTKTYHGRRDENLECHVDIVTSDGRRRPLPLRLDLDNHSPTGFNWGYGGSGPAQLALALLADAFGDDDLAVFWHQEFKRKWVSALPDEWASDEASIRKILLGIRAQCREKWLSKWEENRAHEMAEDERRDGKRGHWGD